MYTPVAPDEKNFASVHAVEAHEKPKPRRFVGFYPTVTSLWLAEWFSWVLALLSTGAIIGVLFAFDGKPLPNWPYGITLGALVSTLSTVTTFCLLTPVSAALGQAKWVYYTRERSVLHFRTIDEASRGPLGSSKLILNGTGGPAAFFGAFLTIALLAVAPFVQQIIQTKTSTVTQDQHATISVAQTYDMPFDDGAQRTDIPLSMKAAVQRGLLDTSVNSSTFDVNPYCTTSNCVWPSYETLSVCSRCTDVSDRLQVTNEVFRNQSTTQTMTALPNGFNVTADTRFTNDSFITMASATTHSLSVTENYSSIAYPQLTQPILGAMIIVPSYRPFNAKNLIGPFASECSVEWCIRTLASSVVNGTFTEVSMSDEPIYLDADPNKPGVIQYKSALSNASYYISYDVQRPFWVYLQSLFNQAVYQHKQLTSVNLWPDDTSEALFYWINGTDKHMPTQVFENLAASMSQKIRSGSTLAVQGDTLVKITTIHVNWYWMILPLTVQVLVFFHLVTTIVVTRKKHLKPWKTDVLAVLFHGLEYGSRVMSEVRNTATLDQMEATARDFKMELVADASNGLGIVDSVREYYRLRIK